MRTTRTLTAARLAAALRTTLARMDQAGPRWTTLDGRRTPRRRLAHYARGMSVRERPDHGYIDCSLRSMSPAARPAPTETTSLPLASTAHCTTGSESAPSEPMWLALPCKHVRRVAYLLPARLPQEASDKQCQA